MNASPKAVLYLDRYEVFKEMRLLAYESSKNDPPETQISLLDVLDFLGDEKVDPFRRISWDSEWQFKLEKMLLETSSLFLSAKDKKKKKRQRQNNNNSSSSTPPAEEEEKDSESSAAAVETNPEKSSDAGSEVPPPPPPLPVEKKQKTE